jgi:hypothetical protein
VHHDLVEPVIIPEVLDEYSTVIRQRAGDGYLVLDELLGCFGCVIVKAQARELLLK